MKLNEIKVSKTTDNNWVAQVKVGKYKNGRDRYKSFFSDKRRIAVSRAEQYVNEQTENKAEVNDTHLDDAIKEYLFSYKIHIIKPSSFDNHYFCTHLMLKYIGNHYLSEITLKELQSSVIFQMKEDGYSYSTIKKTHGAIKDFFKYAKDNNLVKDNIAVNLKLPPKKLFDINKIDFLDDAEIEAYKTEALKGDYINGALLVAMIYTGLRSGEMCALKKKDIDFDRKSITVNKNLCRICQYEDGKIRGGKTPLVQNSTKTSEGRIVKMSKSAIKYFKLHFEMHPEIGDNDNIIISRSKKNLLSDSGLRSQHKTILSKIGVNGKTGLHSLRHTCASLMIRRGIDIKVVSEVLGHTDPAFTYKTYVHIIDKQKQEAMDALDF